MTHLSTKSMETDLSFHWGVATASYQIEGAWQADGKGMSIWDAHTHTPGHIENNENGDVACDHYHLYERDIELMADLGVNTYRFSIAWSRIYPDGESSVNEAGVAFYNRLIDALLAKGITPFVTLYHWDLPLALQLKHDGWLSYRTAERYAQYAETCFSAFGDRVKHWITFNENWCSAVLGYGTGYFAPGRVSKDEPYIAGHNLLLAHGLAVDRFRRGNYHGVIGIANNCDWREPLTQSMEDKSAAQESLEFFYGWFTDPVVFGKYPDIMRERLGKRLPSFTAEQEMLMRGSCDFLGLNHYTTHYASRQPVSDYAVADEDGNGGIAEDQQVHLSYAPSWQKTSTGWYVVPWGFRKLLNWIHQRYGQLPIYVTENGCSVFADSKNEAIDDQFRCDFIQGYTDAMLAAMTEDGVDCRSYCLWTLMDNFEWCRGYNMRFGLIHTDFETRQRTPKASFERYREIIAQNS